VYGVHVDFVGDHRIGVVGLSLGQPVYLTFRRAPGAPPVLASHLASADNRMEVEIILWLLSR
jgi:hypothetical protein